MMKSRLLSLLFLAGLCCAVTTSSAQSWWQDAQEKPFYQQFIKDRLEIGLRMTYFKYTDAEKRSYDANGNLTGGYTAGISTYNLADVQYYAPLPYLRYNIIKYLALQIAWERTKGKADTLDPVDPHNDGNLILSGPSLMLLGRYPNETIFTPYAGIGFAFLSADFEEDDSWSQDGFLNMESEDTTGFMLSLGCSIQLMEYVAVDLSLSYMQAKSDTRYWIRGENYDRATWEYPADALLYQMGVKFLF